MVALCAFVKAILVVLLCLVGSASMSWDGCSASWAGKSAVLNDSAMHHDLASTPAAMQTISLNEAVATVSTSALLEQRAILPSVVPQPSAAHAALAAAAAAATAALIWFALRRPAVYCVHNAVFVPPESWQASHQEVKVMLGAQGCFNDKSMSFLSRILEQSGIGDSTHGPPACLPCKDGRSKGDSSMAMARHEAQAVIFPIVREVLEKSGVRARDVDFLIVNCSIFTPTPSLCAMISHEFGMREDVRSYNLGGMGCSANVISVDLAKQLLQSRPGSRAIVVSTEIITPCFYSGNDKAMLLQNVLFRVGGVALLLSSRRSDAARAKYQLLLTIRSQMSDDRSYSCVSEQEDAEGNRGVALSKDILKVAERAMRQNFARLGPHVLAPHELVKTGLNRLLIALAARAQKAGFPGLAAPEAYTPDFTSGIDHFCIHAGGRAVIDGVQESLGLSEAHMRPSKQTLCDWGNTSSSSIWYEAEWVERFGDLRRGDRVLQVAFGSGFKCNTAVWRALRVDRAKRGVPFKSTCRAAA